MSTSPGTSPDQSGTEPLILERLSQKMGIHIAPQRQFLEGDAFVDVDGVADDGSMLVEVFAHSGGLKGGQRQKIATKILKLITVALDRDPRPRLILAVTDPSITAWTASTNWHAGALVNWGIEVFLVELSGTNPEQPAEVRRVLVRP